MYDDYDCPTIRGLLKFYVKRDLARIRRFFTNLSIKLKLTKPKVIDQKYGKEIYKWISMQPRLYEAFPKQPWINSDTEESQ